MHTNQILYRSDVLSTDADAVRKIVAASGCFSGSEIDIAVELVDERLSKGLRSGYHFFFAQQGEAILGYTCFGPIPCTASSYDLYWIAVDPIAQGSGVSRELLRRSEVQMQELGATQIYIDTSSRSHYDRARGFYKSCGYRFIAEFPNFYGQDDGKVVCAKAVEALAPGLVLEPAAIDTSCAWLLAPEIQPLPIAAFCPA